MRDGIQEIIGEDPALLEALARVRLVAPTTTPVLVTGESGVGKELFARALHELGPNPHGPFVAVNCGALPRELAESELFGHERGAFTGAAGRRAGWFEEASGGTLMLDEIGELPLDLQPKLLRVLETGRLRRVGGAGEIPVRVRVVAMTLRNLETEVQRHCCLCELNVIEQVVNGSQTTVVRDAWSRRQALTIHGWIYALRDGLLQDLDMCVTGEAELQDRYEQARAGVRRRTS